jgi:hypothetical protein
MNNLIINVSTGGYVRGAERLRNSLLENGFGGDLLFFTEESQVNAPIHVLNPYAFKTYTFEYALNLGYKKILWLDASVYAIKNIDRVWEILDDIGFLMQNAGHLIGNWTNDTCLHYFGINREQALQMNMYGNAGLLGLNFERQICSDFFQQWHQSSKDGIFKGEWTNKNNTESQDERCFGHRHDMSAGSIIANKLCMNEHFFSTTEILEYAPPHTEPINDTIIFKAQGM